MLEFKRLHARRLAPESHTHQMKTCEYKVAHQLVRPDGSSYYSVFETFDTKMKARLWIEKEQRSGDPAIVILKVESKVVWRPSPTEVDTP